MIIIETCPKCGHDLTNEVICTYPPIPKKNCWNCGWHWEREPEHVMRVPFGGNSLGSEWERNYLGKWNISDPVLNNINFKDASINNFGSPTCAGCPSNPKNGGDGICFCTLGQIEIR